jgi:hypothetical protein
MTIKRTFTTDWATAKSWGSMQLKALAIGLTALQQGWPNLPGSWKSSLPASVPHFLAYGAIASIVGAAYSQVTKKATKP